MRDPNRLDAFYDELKELHKQYCPDLRFGQLMTNFFSMSDDPFYWEEDRFMEEFKKFLKDFCGYDENKKIICNDEDIVPALIYIPKSCVGLSIKAEIYDKGEMVTAHQDMNTEEVYNARVKGQEYEDENAYYVLTDKGIDNID